MFVEVIDYFFSEVFTIKPLILFLNETVVKKNKIKFCFAVKKLTFFQNLKF